MNFIEIVQESEIIVTPQQKEEINTILTAVFTSCIHIQHNLKINEDYEEIRKLMIPITELLLTIVMNLRFQTNIFKLVRLIFKKHQKFP